MAVHSQIKRSDHMTKVKYGSKDTTIYLWIGSELSCQSLFFVLYVNR